MADVAISRPAANEKQTIQSQPDAKYIFDFQAGDATVTRDGNNLLLNFDDGAGVAIENFYETHTQESMPSFQIDGQEVAGQAFFEALNEPDLMPAAGPAAAQAPERGGRYNDYGNSDLNGGLDHLTRLDYESGRGFEWENPNWITSPDWDGGYLTGAAGPLVTDSLRPGTSLDSGIPPLATTRPEPTPPNDLDTPDYTPPVTTPPSGSITPPPSEPGIP
ncbi:MAG: hypothetical protein HDQ44_04940, partial [Desulfovibrio sp.]|nr:hypothetical protein [Desulfovibrio sp.]